LPQKVSTSSSSLSSFILTHPVCCNSPFTAELEKVQKCPSVDFC
jgi:hypothetical protein